MNVSSPKTASVQTTQRPTQLQRTEQKTALQALHKASETSKSVTQRPSPVVNTQGHTTGRIINVTA